MSLRGFWLTILTLAAALTAASQNTEEIQVVGVGSTTTVGLYSKWFEKFGKSRPDLHFSYIPSGSEVGIDMVTAGKADFGSTDAPLSDKQLARAKVLQFPFVLGAVVPIYNLPGIVQPLRFSAAALAGIYMGTITRWNDPAIVGPNPRIQLPASAIIVIHGASGRGSTFVWSDYLSKVSVQWRAKIGRGLSIDWPVGKEADGMGNLARMVKETPNAIGYVELPYALRDHITYGQVQNAAGKFIRADSIAMWAAAASQAKGLVPVSRPSITDSPDNNSYPISCFSWILISQNAGSPAKHAAIKDFLRWMLGEGQTYVEDAGFARLPTAISEKVLDALARTP